MTLSQYAVNTQVHLEFLIITCIILVLNYMHYMYYIILLGQCSKALDY